MKKVLALISGFFLMFALTACGNNNKAGEHHGDTSAKTTFTVGFDAGFPPFGYKAENGQYEGFDLEAAAEVAKRNGWEFVPNPIDWDAKDAELNSGQIDAIWNGFTKTGREANYEFSEAYGNDPIGVAVKKGSGITSLADLKGKNVVVQADSSGLAALKDGKGKELAATFGHLDEVPEYNTAFMNLDSGAADAIVIDHTAAHFNFKERGADKYELLDEVVMDQEYGVGFKKGNTELRNKVQASLDEMKKDGTLRKIAEKYNLTDVINLD